MSFEVVFLPAFVEEADAIAWAFDRGLEDVRIWRGPDGLVRGSGRRRLAVAS